jgi:hypothetical protein
MSLLEDEALAPAKRRYHRLLGGKARQSKQQREEELDMMATVTAA